MRCVVLFILWQHLFIALNALDWVFFCCRFGCLTFDADTKEAFNRNQSLVLNVRIRKFVIIF